jgi:autotransporter-associated beta strand protein
LQKIGSGTLALTASNTYAGPTTINQGNLAVNGALGGLVIVNSGGILSGTGSLSNVAVNMGGQLAPGNSPGVMFFSSGGILSGTGNLSNVANAAVNMGALLAPGNSPGVMFISGSLSLAAGAVMDFELDTPSTSDSVLMPSGQLVLDGQEFSDFNFTPLSRFGPGTYTLFDAASITGSLGPSTSGAVDGYPATLVPQGNNELLLNVVPEPSTLALLVVAAGGWAAYRRRRRIQPT